MRFGRSGMQAKAEDASEDERRADLESRTRDRSTSSGQALGQHGGVECRSDEEGKVSVDER